jgi:transposase-like protein
MRKSKFSESQIVGMLKGAESGMPVADLLRKHGVSKATFFKWRSSSRPDQIPKQSTRFDAAIAIGMRLAEEARSQQPWHTVANSPSPERTRPNSQSLAVDHPRTPPGTRILPVRSQSLSRLADGSHVAPEHSHVHDRRSRTWPVLSCRRSYQHPPQHVVN